jgi:C-terminal processing protease CtpA/Prc
MPPERMMKTLTGGMAPAAGRPAASRPLGKLLDGGIGFVVVPPHEGRNRPAYVDSLQTQIGALDSAGACGWVVDLRENTGGNIWPMLAGVGPLLDAEVVGSTTENPPGVGWHYRDGRSWSGGYTPPAEPLGWSSAAPRRVANANAPVALLVGRQTASSGEILLVAFLGRGNVRSFGDSTAGRNSVNTSVPLSDGATLIVTSAYPRDRLGRSYPLTVAPDELVSSDRSAGGDAALRSAVAWLRRQSACAARR